MKQFVLGLPSPKFLSLTELDLICKKYGDKIKYWYISPPFGEKYSSRRNILSDFTIQNIQLIQSQFQILNDNNQKIELALNSRNLLNTDIKELLFAFELFCKIYQIPNSLVLLKEFIPYFTQFNIPITYSYNNPIIEAQCLKNCNTIVLGNRQMRDINLMEKLKYEYNLTIELLVNNGCHFLCNRKCGSDCKDFQLQLLAKKGKYQCLAEQSFLPYELKYINNYIDLIKISSRPSTYNELNNNIYLYNSEANIDDILKIIPLTTIKNWKHFAKLTHIINAFDQDEIIDYKKIIQLKNNIWENILNKRSGENDQSRNIFTT